MGVLLTLGFVLALLGVALKLLRRFAPTSTSGSRVRMEVVQRLALGPKQGIAVIRVGERFVAVSVGDGGIRRLFELEENEVAASAKRDDASGDPRDGSPRPNSPLDFGSAFRGALKTAGLAVMLSISVHAPAHAQTKTQQQNQTPAQNAAAQQARFNTVSKAVAQTPDGS